jgi:hypothetical protein
VQMDPVCLVLTLHLPGYGFVDMFSLVNMNGVGFVTSHRLAPTAAPSPPRALPLPSGHPLR